MKLNARKLGALVLILIFAVSAVFCCCLTEKAEAKAAAPSCHSTDHASDQSQEKADCDCDQSFIPVVLNIDQTPVELSVFLEPVESTSAPASYEISTQASLHAPPLIKDLIPLFIKHSNLRI